MTATEYVKKLEEICIKDFISAVDLVRELDISHNTWMRAKRDPSMSAMKTMKKIKSFVDRWEKENLSTND
jgi:hypothetical protein